ncbi:MAG TPA: hypothetical protein VKE70_23100 [Candidatus Solibacter sp.]|nr:hypothetical protein [Candidatus Solibacter sp.]
MIDRNVVRPICILLSALIAIPAGFAQAPVAGQAKPPEPIPMPLTVAVIEGNNAVNSVPLMKSVTPVVEVRDQNEFPVEGAMVVFTMPEQGPGGRFPGGSLTFTTRSDARGQAAGPFIVNNVTGKFQIKVTATAGNRKGDALITQTNTTGGYIGVSQPKHPWYKKWYVWGILGGAGAGAAIGLTRGGSGSSSSTIVFTPGGPVVGGPR